MSIVLTERKELHDKAVHVADMVARSLEMSLYKQAERDLRTDEQAQRLLVAMQTRQTEGEGVEDLLDQLEALDVARRFAVAQEGVAELVSHVTKILAASLSGRLDLVMEGDGCCGDCTVCEGASACTEAAATACTDGTNCAV